MPPERKPLPESAQEINRFIQAHENWVIEGCYADLLEIALVKSNEIIFMNLSIKACIANAKTGRGSHTNMLPKKPRTPI